MILVVRLLTGVDSLQLMSLPNNSCKKALILNNISKYISHMAPCIEVVGYRQRKKGITSFGDLCSDFGANVKFLVGSKKKYKRIDFDNLKTNISNNNELIFKQRTEITQPFINLSKNLIIRRININFLNI